MENLLVVYGCGGHKAQADRLCRKLIDTGEKMSIYSVTDLGDRPYWSIEHLELKEFRNKYSGKLISISEALSQLRDIYIFIKENNIKNVISLGPGVSILVCVVAKLMGCVIVHIETWSKFESLTFSTKINKCLTKNVFYQNQELKKLLPKGKYVGRL